MQGKRAWQVILVFVLLGLWALGHRPAASDPEATPSGVQAVVPGSGQSIEAMPPSPAETVQTLRSLHLDRDYAGIAPWVIPERRDSFVRLIKAVDAVIDANARLKSAAESRFGGPMGEAWDLSSMENNLGPLSKDLVLLNQRFRGDSAEVTLQEGDHIPLVRATFHSRDGRWLYEPEIVPEAVTDELWRLACLVNEVEESVRGGATFEFYFDSFMQRILPQMARVATVQDEPETSIASSGVSPD